MANQAKQSGVAKLIFLGIIIAAIVLGVLFYIGWFDNRTKVDVPDQNVTEAIVSPDASPAEADWQNADRQSLDQIIADPENPTATPPSAD